MKTSLQRRRRRGQEGVVLFVALIVLVIMALAGVAMIRSAGTGLAIAGNVGMRQNAITGADLGAEAALAWFLTKDKAYLKDDHVADGYYSDWGASDPKRRAGDPSLYDWDTVGKYVADDSTGNKVWYIVERLCETAGTAEDAATQHCVQTRDTNGSDYSGTCDHYPASCFKAPAVTHYRVSARAIGPRSTVSYIQVMVKPQLSS